MQQAAPETQWLSGDLLALLVAVCAMLLAVNLSASALSPSPATHIVDEAEHIPVDAQTNTARAVELVTPLHLPASVWPDLWSEPSSLAANENRQTVEERRQPEAIAPPTATLLFPETALESLDKPISVIRRAHEIRFRIPSDALFASAQATLTPAGIAILQPLIELLQHSEHAIAIEGHADNTPIRSQRYPSNWELSASRAASVLRQLEQCGIAPERLHARGYAHTQAIADNTSEAGRAVNRRVEIAITVHSAPSPQQRD